MSGKNHSKIQAAKEILLAADEGEPISVFVFAEVPEALQDARLPAVQRDMILVAVLEDLGCICILHDLLEASSVRHRRLVSHAGAVLVKRELERLQDNALLQAFKQLLS